MNFAHFSSERDKFTFHAEVCSLILLLSSQRYVKCPRGGGGGAVLPYMGYIGMCGPKRYGFLAVLVIDRVSLLADFGHFGHK